MLLNNVFLSQIPVQFKSMYGEYKHMQIRYLKSKQINVTLTITIVAFIFNMRKILLYVITHYCIV